MSGIKISYSHSPPTASSDYKKRKRLAKTSQAIQSMRLQWTRCGRWGFDDFGNQLSHPRTAYQLSAKTEDMQATHIMSMFWEGNVVLLRSCASNMNLRITQGGTVEGLGGEGEFAQFRVHVRRPGVVALQNVKNPENWLAIFQEKTIGTGKGDPFCEFIINEVEGRYACLESVKSPGRFVGILPDGTVKPPGNTKTGQHGRFIVSTTTQTPPISSYPSNLQSLFWEGNVVLLRSCASNMNLRITQGGTVEGLGGEGEFAQFRVHVRRPGVVALQNIKNPEHWLAIYQGNTIGTGKGGSFCELKLTELDDQCVCLESVSSPGQFVGILPTGAVKPPGNTKTGQHGRFTVSFIQTPPISYLSPLQSKFSHGNVVLLRSCASNMNLRITQGGTVEGLGGEGQFAQFRVHVRHPGVVALQNIKNPEHWLAIYQGNTIGSGRGGPFCELKMTEIDDQCVCLESVSSPGQFVGILPTGAVKPSGNTKTGQHGRFTVSTL